jgi:hypothetical protein
MHSSQVVLVRDPKQFKLKFLPFEQPFWGSFEDKQKGMRKQRTKSRSKSPIEKVEKLLDQFIFEKCTKQE